MTGWAPSPTTPQAAKRGSATISFNEMASELAKKGALAGSVQQDDGEGGAVSEEADSGKKQS